MSTGSDVNRQVQVDLCALASNYRLLRDVVAPSRCAAVVKADAYGLGLRPIAKTLEAAGCDAFFVATTGEGVELRQILANADIYVLEGVDRNDAETLRSRKIIPVLNTLDQILIWSQHAPNCRSILQVDTGMSRLGLSASQCRKVSNDASLLHALEVDYLMTHLACADEPDHPYNARQLEKYNHIRDLLPGYRTSIGNSSAIFLGDEFRGDMVRVGIALFGGNPQRGRENPMQSVIRVMGRIIQVREVEQATGVGYGATVAIRPRSKLATVAFGYADGYRRSLGNRAQAIVGNVRVPVLGRVSMDSLTLDISDVPANVATEGKWVTLIGDGEHLDDVAANAGTISYELLVGIGRRVQRIYT